MAEIVRQVRNLEKVSSFLHGSAWFAELDCGHTVKIADGEDLSSYPETAACPDCARLEHAEGA